MDRSDILIEENDYIELLKWAKLRNQELAISIEKNKSIIENKSSGVKHYNIKANDIDPVCALELLNLLLENEQYTETDEECLYFGHLAEVWRPIAEGPLS